jgi:hypothetical protein
MIPDLHEFFKFKIDQRDKYRGDHIQPPQIKLTKAQIYQKEDRMKNMQKTYGHLKFYNDYPEKEKIKNFIESHHHLKA